MNTDDAGLRRTIRAEIERELKRARGLDLLTTIEAAQQMKLSKRTLERWRVEGGGPPYLKLGRAVRYRGSALRRWIDEHEVRSTSEY